eukprot:TRINITY_DN358_c0_g1_i2.p1 TRINITY_DN358_c0_g1~~TRINITY_DN358_c0_g1_i2.p1  ORF type:complete len:299 (+),score=46.43 TRINITY_DN358_c0_g1_i2:567-1463(+)
MNIILHWKKTQIIYMRSKIEQFSIQCKVHPNESQSSTIYCFFNLGNLFDSHIDFLVVVKTGRVVDAIRDYELAVSLNSQDFESSFSLGVVYAAVAHNKTFLSASPSPTSDVAMISDSEKIPDEQRSEYIELAIKNFKNALNYCLKEKKPEYWALTQEELALLYCERVAGQTGYNLEESIRHFKNALQVRTKDKFPLPWARIRNSLGTSFSRRQRGDKNYNLNNALTHYESALTVFTVEQNFFEFIAIKYNYALTLKKAERFSEATAALKTNLEYLESWKQVNTSFEENEQPSPDLEKS